MTDRNERIARETAGRVVAYEREEGAGRDDAFRTPRDVRWYAEAFGWLDDSDEAPDAECGGDLDEFEALVTELVIDALFN